MPYILAIAIVFYGVGKVLAQCSSHTLLGMSIFLRAFCLTMAISLLIPKPLFILVPIRGLALLYFTYITCSAHTKPKNPPE
jgi:hypothetical protein